VEGDNKVLKAKKTTFSSRHGLCNILFLSLSKLGACLQNLIFTRGVEHWEKNYFPQGGMVKFTYKVRFLTIKRAYKKLLYWKSKQWVHDLIPPLRTWFSFLKNLNFWWYFKVHQANCLWVDLFPHLKGKKENIMTYAKSVRILHVMANWKALWISHLPKKFQKIQLQIGIVAACPKSINSIYGTHSPLGIKRLR
jgi:hypothetical protein